MFLQSPRPQTIHTVGPDGANLSDLTFGIVVITTDEIGRECIPYKNVVFVIKRGDAEQSFRLPVAMARMVSEELANFIDFAAKPLSETNPDWVPST